MLQNTSAECADDPSLVRLGAFSDGVFAFAITLLVLTIRIPHPSDADAGNGLVTLLVHQWRNFIAFVLSFMLVGINWAHHRVMFSKFVRANHVLIWLNMLYLMLGVAFMPIPTAILGDWIGNPRNQVVAAVFYGAASTIGGLAFNIIWWYGAYAGKLTFPTLSANERHAHTTAWCLAPLIVATLTVVAFVNPTLAVAGYILTVLLYVLPLPGVVARHRRLS